MINLTVKKSSIGKISVKNVKDNGRQKQRTVGAKRFKRNRNNLIDYLLQNGVSAYERFAALVIHDEHVILPPRKGIRKEERKIYIR